MHLAKIAEMKSISKPHLLVEVYTICQNLSSEEYRKNSFFPRGNFALLPNLMLPPTNQSWKVYWRPKDYELKLRAR